ncbi:hypothetical protein LEMLEM_LOCUS10834 [Lemmus lemmus]
MSHGCWELNLCPLEDHPVMLVTSLGVPSKPAMWYFPAGPQLTGSEESGFSPGEQLGAFLVSQTCLQLQATCPQLLWPDIWALQRLPAPRLLAVVPLLFPLSPQAFWARRGLLMLAWPAFNSCSPGAFQSFLQLAAAWHGCRD